MLPVRAAPARSYWPRGARGERPQSGGFVALNCAAIPRTPGKRAVRAREGAFTGAVKTTEARSSGSRGTLFLDEVGDTPAAAVKLRASSGAQIERIGGRKMIDVDTRIVCARIRTSSDDRRRRFREDLFYRLPRWW